MVASKVTNRERTRALKTMDTGCEVRKVSDQHPQWQAVAWVRHEVYEGGVLWAKGPRRFTRNGARQDLRRVALILGQQQRRLARKRGREIA